MWKRERLAYLKASSFMHGKDACEFWSWKHLALLLPPRDQINEIYASSILPHTHSYTSFNFRVFFYSWAFRYMRTVAYMLTAMYINDTYFVFEHIYMVQCPHMEILFFPSLCYSEKKNLQHSGSNYIIPVILFHEIILLKIICLFVPFLLWYPLNSHFVHLFLSF